MTPLTNGPSAPYRAALAPEPSTTPTAPPNKATTKPFVPSATASSASSTAAYATTTRYDEHTAWAHRQTADTASGLTTYAPWDVC